VIEAVDQSMVQKEININNQLVITRALEKLPARQREVIFLKFYQELKNDDIEQIMGLNNQVVRNTLYKALHSLRQQMKVWERNAHYHLLLCLSISYTVLF
jgi:RNA polymerase sigma-70 factor (ECF subfamily)